MNTLLLEIFGSNVRLCSVLNVQCCTEGSLTLCCVRQRRVRLSAVLYRVESDFAKPNTHKHRQADENDELLLQIYTTVYMYIRNI